VKKLIVIGGPTASGKTALAIELALHLKTEILSADSRQFYREMAIGTAKPTLAELAQVPHHFINNLSIHDNYSVGDFEQEALALLNKLFLKYEFVIMVGGTGLYIQALCEGLDSFPDTPLSIRAEFEQIFQQDGIEALQKRLQEIDPQYFKEVDPNNPARLIRALSVWRASGQPYSSFLKKRRTRRDFSPIYFALDIPRLDLYTRINKRVDTMIADGLIDEARTLFPFRHLPPLKTVGYTELFDHFEGKYTEAEAIEKIKQHTRNYAKRQMTWFRKKEDWQWILPSETTVQSQRIPVERTPFSGEGVLQALNV
jgi:tRNA dimethylallyltransferase